MGLDTTHGCWHGSYSSFAQFRQELALLVGIKLDEMDGFGGPRPWPDRATEPLVILLDHSDCDGAIAIGDLQPLAERLAALGKDLPDGWLRDKALGFAAGLEFARAQGEEVEFW